MKGKKGFCLLLTAILAAGTISACAAPGVGSGSVNSGDLASSGTVESTSEGTGEGSQTQPESQKADYYKKYDPVITMTQGMTCPDNIFPEGKSVENNAYTDWCKEQVGIEWKAKWVAPDAETNTQKMNLAMASNDLPDIMFTVKGIINKMAKAGQIVPLDSYLEDYSSDLVKYVNEEIQAAEDGMLYVPFKYDGSIYGIPSYAHPVDPEYNWYRQDILKELGLKAPTTIDEFENVLKALKAKYPEKIGLMIEKTGISATVMDAYGSFPKIWQEKDGNLQYGAVQPETKAALAKLAEWYAQGYLDKEFVVADSEAKWAAGDIFARSTMWWLNWGSSIQLPKNVSGAEVGVFGYLKGEDGFQGRVMSSGISTGGYCISKNSQNPEALFILYNHYTDSAYRNETDLREKFDFQYAAEPVQVATNQAEYEKLVEGGENVDKALAMRTFEYKQVGPDQGDSEGFLNEYVNHGYRFGIRTYQRATALRDAFDEGFTALKNGTDLGTINPYSKMIADQAKNAWGEQLCIGMLEGVEIAKASRDKEVRDMFIGAPTPTMVEKKAYLDKLQDEAFVKIIMGEAEVDYFDTFVSDWKANGGDLITEEVNAWYTENK